MSADIRTSPLRPRALYVAVLAVFPLVASAGTAGRFQFVAGDVRVVGTDGRERPALKGQDVNEGETLLSGPSASAQVRMVDGGMIALRPDTHVKLDTYTFHGAEDGKEKAFISLLKGGFRTITGLIGKTNKQNYSISTGTATIGIRGTDHEPMVILPPPPGVTAVAPAGTYDKVNVGSTSLATAAGTAVIAPRQVGFVAGANETPVILPKVPAFYQATTTPQAKQEQKKEDKQGASKQESSKEGSGKGDKGSDKAAEKQDSGKQDAGKQESAKQESSGSKGSTETAAATPSSSTASDSSTSSSGATDSGSSSTQTASTSSSTSSTTSSSTSTSASTSTSTTTATAPTTTPDTSVRVAAPADSVQLAVVAPVATVSAAVVPTVMAPVATVPTVTTLTGTDASGTTLNTTTQTQTTSSGTAVPITSTVATTSYVPGSVLVGSYSYFPGADSSSRSYITTQVQAAQTALDGFAAQLTSGNSAAAATQAALAAGQSAANSGNSALGQATTVFGAGHAVLTQVADVLNTVNHVLQLGRNAYDGSGTGTAGSAGVVNTLAYADKSWQAANGLLASAQTQLAGTSVANIQEIDFRRQSLSYLNSQLSSATSDTYTAGTAATDAQNYAAYARSVAQSAAAGLSAYSSDSNFQTLKAASDAATAAANAAWDAAAAASAAVTTTQAMGNSAQPLFNAAETLAGSTGWGPYSSGFVAAGNLTLNRNAAGEIIGASSSQYAGSGTTQTLTASGGVLMDSGSTASGLAWGRWQGGQVTSNYSYWGRDASGNWGIGAWDNVTQTFVIGSQYTYTSNLGNGSVHWITGNEAYPGYLGRVLTGTATYTLAGGTRPTDSLGNVGTLNGATLSANFTAQTVDAAVNFSIGGDSWILGGTGLALRDGAGFYGYSCVGCSGTDNYYRLTSFTKNGVQVQPVTYNRYSGTSTYSSTYTPYANFDGRLLGKGLGSAALQYSVTDFILSTQTDSLTGQSITTATPNVIQGVAGFSGPTQDAATPYRLVGFEDGYASSLGGSGYSYYGPMAVGFMPYYYPYAGATVNGGYVHPTAAPVGRVVDGAAGLSEFVGSAAYQPTGQTYLNWTERATIRVGTATNQDVGSTTIDGITISWGRWAGGSVDIYTADGSIKLGTVLNTDKSMHWVASGTLTGPVSTSLPLTGTATYTLAGNTNPTDFQNNVGTLGSATLNADFSRMLVNTSVTASFNTATHNATWSMTANNVPIAKQGSFGSSTGSNGANGITHTASCTGTSCGSQTVGAISGSFVGTAAAGAVVSYRMATGSTDVASNGIVGTAVFRK